MSQPVLWDPSLLYVMIQEVVALVYPPVHGILTIFPGDGGHKFCCLLSTGPVKMPQGRDDTTLGSISECQLQLTEREGAALYGTSSSTYSKEIQLWLIHTPHNINSQT